MDLNLVTVAQILLSTLSNHHSTTAAQLPEDMRECRTHLAAQTAQARKEWMFALAAAAARSGSAGASSSSTATGEVQGVEPTPVSSGTAASSQHSDGMPAISSQSFTAATAAAAGSQPAAEVDCHCPLQCYLLPPSVLCIAGYKLTLCRIPSRLQNL